MPEAGEHVVVATLPIQPPHVVVAVAQNGVRNWRRLEVVARAAACRGRQCRQPRRHDRVDAIGTDHVGGVAVAAHELILDEAAVAVGAQGRRVVDRNQVAVRVAPIAEVTRAFLHRGYRQHRRRGSPFLPVPLVVEVEEALPLFVREAGQLDRAADVDAVVVLVEIRLLRPAPLRGRERVVLVELKTGTVEPAAARLGDRHDLAADRGAVFGRVARREDLDLADHVGRHREVLENRHHAALAHEALLHADAIHRRLVARLQAAVDARVKGVVALTGADTGHQQRKCRGRARSGAELQGQIVQGFRRDPMLLRARRAEHRRAAEYLDALGDGPGSDRDDHPDLRPERDFDVGQRDGVEAVLGRLNLVLGRRQVAEGEAALRTRDRRRDDFVSGDVAQGQSDIRNDGAACVLDDADDGAVDGLSRGRHRTQQQQDQGRTCKEPTSLHVDLS